MTAPIVHKSLSMDDIVLPARKVVTTDFADEYECVVDGKLTIDTRQLTLETLEKGNNDDMPEACDKTAPESNSTLSSSGSLAQHQQQQLIAMSAENDNVEKSDNDPDDATDNGNDASNTCGDSPYHSFLFSSDWLGSGELQLPDMSMSTSHKNGNSNDDSESVMSGGYFEPVDLDSSNWMKAIQMNGPTFGVAIVAVATAVVHPLLFVAGALTAFGAIHAAGAGYDYCGAGKMCGINSSSSSTGKKRKSRFYSSSSVAASWEHTMLNVCQKGRGDKAEDSSSITLQELELSANKNGTNNSNSLPALALLDKPDDSTAERSTTTTTGESSDDSAMIANNKINTHPQRQTNGACVPAEPLTNETIEQVYLPLKNNVVQGVPFPGLHAIEFFKVFFDDDAPYNFMELQKQRGDQDIVYGKWEALQAQEPAILHQEEDQHIPALVDANKADFKGRVLTFKAKTNNFMGPVYAGTRKTQRILLHHKTLVVMESRTDLSDIPFADRFYVLERWIIRATKVREDNNKKAKYVSTLHATSQVVFTQSCQFSSQIKSKSAAAIQDLVSCWCTMAKEALKLTEERKLQRLKHEQGYDSDEDETTQVDDELNFGHSSEQQRKENRQPPEEEEGIEVTWPKQNNEADEKKTQMSSKTTKPKLRHSGSLPLPSVRGRAAIQGFKRSVSTLLRNNNSNKR